MEYKGHEIVEFRVPKAGERIVTQDGIIDTAQGEWACPRAILKDHKEKKPMLKEFKTFLTEHRDMVFMVLLLLAADTFFLEGALRTKLTSLLQAQVAKLEGKAADNASAAN